MDASGGEACGEGGVALEAFGAATATDTEEDPENDRGRCEADQDEYSSNSSRIPKKTGRRMMGMVDQRKFKKNTNLFPFEVVLFGERVGFETT